MLQISLPSGIFSIYKIINSLSVLYLKLFQYIAVSKIILKLVQIIFRNPALLLIQVSAGMPGRLQLNKVLQKQIIIVQPSHGYRHQIVLLIPAAVKIHSGPMKYLAQNNCLYRLSLPLNNKGIPISHSSFPKSRQVKPVIGRHHFLQVLLHSLVQIPDLPFLRFSVKPLQHP